MFHFGQNARENRTGGRAVCAPSRCFRRRLLNAEIAIHQAGGDDIHDSGQHQGNAPLEQEDRDDTEGIGHQGQDLLNRIVDQNEQHKSNRKVSLPAVQQGGGNHVGQIGGGYAAQQMADKVTAALTGAGIWGVEFFVSEKEGVIFSELSPRPHDTGMVTLAGTQNLSEFELHCRAVLGLPIPEITQERQGASAVILSPVDTNAPQYDGMEDVCAAQRTYLRIFGKPEAHVGRRMGVVVCWDDLSASQDALRDKCKALAAKVTVR